MRKVSFSDLDQEIITLAAVWDLVGSMVHYGHFEKGHRTTEATLMFKTREASKIFLVVLADFLSLPGNGMFGLAKPTFKGSLGKTYLGLLRNIVNAPQFGSEIEPLASSVDGFATWLDGHITVDGVWLPSINLELSLRIQRMMYLKICGNVTKHGFTRLDRVVPQIRAVLADSGAEVDEGECYLAIPDLREWLQDHIFISSSTLIAWHLNEIRWAIYEYLSPEHLRSYTPTEATSGLQLYKYDFPNGVTNPLVQSIYWDLMNSVSRPPYFPRFSVDRFARDRF